MEKINYAYIANNLLGDELYCKFIKEISKENRGGNLADFGKEVFEKCCMLITSLGMSNTIKTYKIKLCIGSEIVEISCREFAMKYKKYVTEIEQNVLKQYET